MRNVNLAEVMEKKWEEELRKQKKIKQETDCMEARNNEETEPLVTKVETVKITTFQNPTEEEIQQLLSKQTDSGEKKNC